MHPLPSMLFTLALLALSVDTRAVENSAASSSSTSVQSGTLPSMGFFSTIAADEIYGALKGSASFASIDKEKPGSPIAIRVTHMYGHTSAGTASDIASALFVIGTLGILPGVSNRNLSVTYEVLVNGSVLVSHTYAKNVTRVYNIHSTDKTHELGSDGLAWVVGTATEFANDVSHDPRLSALSDEFHFYYGPSVGGSGS